MSGGKGWANPAPAGLVALAVACFIFYALMTGKIEGSAIPLMGCWLVGGFVVQVIVGVIELLEGNSTAGNVFSFFCAFFMLANGLEMFVKFWASVNGIAIDARVDGWAWLALATALTVWTLAYLKESNALLSIAVILIDVAAFMIAFMDMAVLSAAFRPIAGTLLFIAGWLGLYIASAIIVNTAYGKSVLPLPGPILKTK